MSLFCSLLVSLLPGNHQYVDRKPLERREGLPVYSYRLLRQLWVWKVPGPVLRPEAHGRDKSWMLTIGVRISNSKLGWLPRVMSQHPFCAPPALGSLAGHSCGCWAWPSCPEHKPLGSRGGKGPRCPETFSVADNMTVAVKAFFLRQRQALLDISIC